MKILHIYANDKNVGDLISGIAIKKLVKKPMEEVLWESCNREEFLNKIKSLTPNDAVIIGGGWPDDELFHEFLGNYSK